MIGKIFKKFLGKSEQAQSDEETPSPSIIEKTEKVFQSARDRFNNACQEFFTIREKTKNLRETNYKLGLKHLENGNLSEAIFRFRFIKKFWPDLFDAYYQLAYCLVLDNQLRKAKDVLEELLTKEPAYDSKAHDLLQYIRAALQQND